EILERARPAAARIADTAVLETPHREARIRERLFERAGMRDRVFGLVAAAVDVDDYANWPGAFGQSQMPELLRRGSVRNLVIRQRRMQRRDLLKGDWLLVQLFQPRSQYCAINSWDQAGCRTSSRGRNSFITGLMSSTGVPSIASSSLTHTRRPSTRCTRQIVDPIRFGRF